MAAILVRIIPFHKAIRLLLAVVLLINGAIASGFRHVHAAGEETHSHRASDGSHQVCDHVGSHSHKRRSTEAPGHGDRSSLEVRLVAHTHVSLLGIEISLPSSSQSDEEGCEPGSAELYCRNVDSAIVAATRLAEFELLRPVSSRGLAAVAVPTHHAGTNLFPQFHAAYLCDGARLQRSGVLLI